MRSAALGLAVFALCTLTLEAAPPPGESPYGGLSPIGGRIYHVE